MKYEVKVASGRKVQVEVFKGPSDSPEHLQVFMESRFLDGPTTPPSGKQGTHVDLTNVKTGQISLADDFWREWFTHPFPADGANVKVPAGAAVLGTGKTLLDAGKTWLAGHGAPPAGLGALGQWYADLDSARVYKRTRGVLRKLAEIRAEEYDAMHVAAQQVAALALPLHEPEKPPPGPSNLTPDEMEGVKSKLRLELRHEMLAEVMADAEARLYKKIKARVRDEVLNEQFKSQQEKPHDPV